MSHCFIIHLQWDLEHTFVYTVESHIYCLCSWLKHSASLRIGPLDCKPELFSKYSIKQKYPSGTIALYKEHFYFVLGSELCNSWINGDRWFYLFIYLFLLLTWDYPETFLTLTYFCFWILRFALSMVIIQAHVYQTGSSERQFWQEILTLSFYSQSIILQRYLKVFSILKYLF